MTITTNNITNIPTLLNYAKLRVVCLPLVVALAFFEVRNKKKKNLWIQ